MTAPTDWLNPNIERPPLPRREVTPIYTQALAAASSQLAALEETAVLYRLDELTRLLDTDGSATEDPADVQVPAKALVLEPAWPTEVPVEDGTVPVMPRVVRRFSWRWVKARLTWPRLVGGSASGLVLVITGTRWFL